MVHAMTLAAPLIGGTAAHIWQMPVSPSPELSPHGQEAAVSGISHKGGPSLTEAGGHTSGPCRDPDSPGFYCLFSPQTGTYNPSIDS